MPEGPKAKTKHPLASGIKVRWAGPLTHGGESFERPSDKSYAQRLQEARKNATAFFEARFTNIDEFDEIAGYFNEQVSVFEDVYLEIGLLLGARIAFQICGKIAELSDG